MISLRGQGIQTSSAGTSLAADEAATLLYTIEEEKLAGDIYRAFYEQTGLRLFANIAESEDRHQEALLRQAERLDLDVSGLPEEDGAFADPTLQALYDRLLAEGSVSPEAALTVGVFIEETDLIDLQAAQDETDDPVLDRAYAHLETGSANHLDAFQMTLNPDTWDL